MRSRAPRAYTFLPLVFLFALAVVGIGIAWAWNTGTPGAPNQVPLKQLAGIVLIAAFWLWIAGKIADRKGDLVANLIVCPILGLMGLAYGVALYRVTHPPAPGKPPAIAARTPAPPSAASSSSGAASPRPATAPAPTDAASKPPAAVPPPPSPTDLADQKAKPVLDAVRTELLAAIEPVAQRAHALATTVAKAPAHDKKVLSQRFADAQSLEKDLAALRKTLSESTDAIQKRLADAGIDPMHTLGIAIRFDHEFNASTRAFACGRLADLCQRVREESDVLTANFASWRLERGEITCKDAMLKAKLTTPRFFIEADAPSLPQTLSQLRGE